jgi:hypothetical protein
MYINVGSIPGSGNSSGKGDEKTRQLPSAYERGFALKERQW